ncbi:probable dolichyl pyrophosphate Glc1Man9GlcNAc2 alpha-1,3-glucosyltransferase [Limulus polyphemus]|uniref:Alpha-1,3-glucosyltransferase n=1 Tax=Limulus polyphemus TaxID=6850 RepID=A0ABM1BXZ5_LIMPO|nr:probable dolichyl pyrophosphate Glc1Man9GlcNAc2 alpha-1,3-glucosyltransferase [Limulus polyphemus]
MAMPVTTYLSVVLSVTCIKFLFLPTYRSTDFEVHRNWLAVTHSLPFSKWYYESTSEWTLDYPPLFAWFEYVLSHAARWFDTAMLEITNMNYASQMTIFYQRLTVIVADMVLVFAVREWCNLVTARVKREELKDQWYHPGVILSMLLLWNPGLLIVDHIHFQYNGFLYGILLLSIVRIIQDRCVEGAFWFAILLNLKHIYLYVAPAYFVYLLRSYCFIRETKGFRISLLNFIKLALVVILVFGVSFGPFIYLGQLPQVLSRLFPFKRGLSHAYWAPNFWALYNIADKAAYIGAVRLNLQTENLNQSASMTGGLVQEYEHVILPSIAPTTTMVLTILSILPALWNLWQKPGNPWLFLRSVILCAFGSFLYGWHVHEKAILLVLLPLTPLSLLWMADAQIFAFLTPVALFSLFPLLHEEAETPGKILLLLMYSVYNFRSLTRYFRNQWPVLKPALLKKFEAVYLLGLVFLQLYCSFGHTFLGLDKRLPFLPLLLISTYCALGILYAWLRFYGSLLYNQRELCVMNVKKQQ